MEKGINLAEEIIRRESANRMAPFPVYDTEVINDIKKLEYMISKKDDYDNVHVAYCTTCLSLHLKDVEFPKHNDKGDVVRFTESERKLTYCVPCGNTDIKTAHITEWEDFYEERYGERFLSKKKL